MSFGRRLTKPNDACKRMRRSDLIQSPDSIHG